MDRFSEKYEENSCKPIVTKGSLKDDLLRRDFTINAMAMSLNKEDMFELIDEFEGIEDINEYDAVKKYMIEHKIDFEKMIK